MSHIAYDRGDYDSSTKTLHKTTPLAPIRKGPVAWEVDPQVQIIELLTKQLAILEKLLARDPPYHTGSKTVVIESPPDSTESAF